MCNILLLLYIMPPKKQGKPPAPPAKSASSTSTTYSCVSTFVTSPNGTNQTHLEVLDKQGKVEGTFEAKKNDTVVKHVKISSLANLKRILQIDPTPKPKPHRKISNKNK